MNSDFWKILDSIVLSSKLVVDRAKGSHHPKYPGFVYPLDYGYLEGTKSTDGAEIDIWKGSQGANSVCGILCTIDNLKRDSEMKVLLNCSKEDKIEILNFYNCSENMAAMLINRES